MTGAAEDSRVQELLIENANLKDELEAVRLSSMDCVDKLCKTIADLQANDAVALALESMEKKLVVRLSDLRVRVDGMEKKMYRMDEKSAEHTKEQILEFGRVTDDRWKDLEALIQSRYGGMASQFGSLRKEVKDALTSLQGQKANYQENAEVQKNILDMLVKLNSQMVELFGMKQVQKDTHDIVVKLQSHTAELNETRQTTGMKRSRPMHEIGCQTEELRTCSLCKVQLNGTVASLVHELTNQHYLKVLEKLVGEADPSPNEGEASDSDKMCWICDTLFPEKEAMLKHLASKSHVERVVAQLKEHAGAQFISTIRKNLGIISKRGVVQEVVEAAMGQSLRAVAELPANAGDPEVQAAKRRRSMGQEANSADRESDGMTPHPLAITPFSLRQQGVEQPPSVQPSPSAGPGVHRSPLVETPRTAAQRDRLNELAQLLLGRLEQPVSTPTLGSILQQLAIPRQVMPGIQDQELAVLLRNLLETRQQ